MQKIDEISYNLIKNSLNASEIRKAVIAHNMANLNTKGFKASKVVFEDKLNGALTGNKLPLKTTHDKHIKGVNSPLDIKPEVVKDNSTSMRRGGNNVDIDNEATNLAANGILYNALINQANSRIQMRRYAINEGRR